MDDGLRFCPECHLIGRRACVADVCHVCSIGVSCHECHQRLFAEMQNRNREQQALDVDSAQAIASAGFQ